MFVFCVSLWSYVLLKELVSGFQISHPALPTGWQERVCIVYYCLFRFVLALQSVGWNRSFHKTTRAAYLCGCVPLNLLIEDNRHPRRARNNLTFTNVIAARKADIFGKRTPPVELIECTVMSITQKSCHSRRRCPKSNYGLLPLGVLFFYLVFHDREWRKRKLERKGQAAWPALAS